jgi:flagellar biosynthesis protein FlhG
MREDQATGLRALFARRRHRTIGVCGSGSTRVAINLAVGIAQLGHRPLILDRSVGEAAGALGLKARYDLVHALDGDKRVEDILLDGPDGCSLLPAARGLERLAIESADWQKTLHRAVPCLAAAFDVWIVNGLLPGAAPQAPVLLVLAPTARAITTAYGHIKALARAHGRHEFAAVVIRAGSAEAARQVFACVAETAGRFLAARLELLGFVPRERTPLRSTSAIAAPESPAACAFAALAQALLGDLQSDQPKRLAAL